MDENQISRIIVDAAIEVHRVLGGPGLLESVYEEALVHELKTRGLQVERQTAVEITYKDQRLSTPLRLDLLINNSVIVEVKAVETLAPVSRSQLLTYLRLSNKSLGLLINFGEKLVKDGIHRVVNNL
ncbi:MAG: GxxExxY protein [Synoicihabitans sp.]